MCQAIRLLLMITPPRFPLLGEPISLDLVNTLVRRHGRSVDLLERPIDLAYWLRAQEHRLSWPGQITAADVRAVRALRDSIAALLEARRAGNRPNPQALQALNAALATSAGPRMGWTDHGPRMKRRPAGDRLRGALRVVAGDAVSILAGPGAEFVRTCEHPDCVLRFLSRNPRRRWCSSAGCGNRARAARSYARHHNAPSP